MVLKWKIGPSNAYIGRKMKVKVTQSRLTLAPGQNIGVGSLSLLQGIFKTQELNRGLLHCRQILYQLIYQRLNTNKPSI